MKRAMEIKIWNDCRVRLDGFKDARKQIMDSSK